MNFFELKECPKCKKLQHKMTAFRKGARKCLNCEPAPTQPVSGANHGD